MKRLSVCMLFGGESSEHDVSIKSAKNIYAATDKEKYDVRLVYVDLNGRWWLLDKWEQNPDAYTTTQIVVMPGTSKFLTLPDNNEIEVDVIFPILHGKMGEDGTIQGLAAIAHIPIVGCNVESSALCMDKHAAKLLVESVGVPVVPWLTINKIHDEKYVTRHTRGLNPDGPWFVKPSRAGSSVGVSKVNDISNIYEAVTRALEHDDTVLIETAIVGRELEVAVLGNAPTHKASAVGEIISGSEFYDYNDKYSPDSQSKTLLDANLPKALEQVIRSYALDTYSTLGCSGLARVDFLLSDDLIPYMNEVNTLPGFTDISMYPKLWEKKGISQTQLIDRLIELAVE